jgi:UDP:flavonoid glycosyltransferase YjiC (YdhE family)
VSRILFCWEIGGGLGHLFRLLHIGLELREKGHHILWALPRSEHAERILHHQGFRFDEAPVWRPPPKSFPLSLNYAQNLLRNGYWHSGSLRQNLIGWRRHLDSQRPDLVLAEHAPTALLAARGTGIPLAAIGTGFSVPPLTSPMPGLQGWFPIPESHLMNAERVFLEAANPVLQEMGQSPLCAVADIFQDVELFLCTFPEFDHYLSRTDPTYHGPVIYSSKETAPQWPSKSNDNIFVYLKSRDRAFQPVMELIRKSRLPTLAFVPDLDESKRQAFQQAHCIISSQPVDLRSARDRCRFAITCGGHNTGASMLLDGIPLLLCPRHLEQAVWAWRISKQGLAVMIDYFDPKPDYDGKIQVMLDCGTLQKQAGSLATKYSQDNPGERLERIAGRCAVLAGEHP